MNKLLVPAFALVAGLLLGTLFFGGLWWTVRRAVLAKSPARWFLASLWLRMSGVLAGFHLVGRDDWRRLVACLLGFIIARFLVLQLTRRAAPSAFDPAKEAGFAP